VRTARMVKPLKRPKGIVCPACAVPMAVWYTRQRGDGSTLRVRVCQTCGHKERTFERPADQRR